MNYSCQLLIFISIILFSCQKQQLNGRWKATYISDDFHQYSRINFEKFDDYKQNRFEPTLLFQSNTIKYNLEGYYPFIEANHSKYLIENDQFIIQVDPELSDTFEIQFENDSVFSLKKEQILLASFGRSKSEKRNVPIQYDIDLKFTDFIGSFCINLKDNSPITIIRQNDRYLGSDTSICELSVSERSYINSLIQEFYFNDNIEQIGPCASDMAEYELDMEINGKKYQTSIDGLIDLTFELHALLYNLERLTFWKSN